ncbi:TPA: WavE lipopolysaccharide synthesis family protein [Kluyvera georgiana]
MDNKFSIVMQGSILDKHGRLNSDVIGNIKKIRSVFSTAEFILSTWKVNEDIKLELEQIISDYSLVVIYNIDPGCLYSIDGVVSSNVNRMVVSTKNGIKRCSHNFVIKIRTDSYLYNDNLKKILLKIIDSRINHIRTRDKKIFDDYVINCNLFARDARGYIPYLFHPGDICLAGNRTDLLLLFDVPLADNNIFMNISRACFLSFMRFVPEQYVWIHCIGNKTGKIPYNGNQDYNNDLIKTSEIFYANNFISMSAEQLGFSWPKYELIYKNKGLHSIYSLNCWKSLYNFNVTNYFAIDKKSLTLKRLITIVMSAYFFVRTCLLKIPMLRKIAIKLFRQRG